MKQIKAKKTFVDEQKGDITEYLHFYKDINFTPIVQTMPDNVNTITFILPGMLSPSGGRTSVLKLGTFLSRQGYKVNYVSFKPQSIEEIKANAKKNLPNYEGEMYAMEALETLKSDIWVATFWESAYVAKKLDGYKMYFVQDYEPYFYDYGDQYLLAKATYDLGLHIVSLGSWNKMMVESIAIRLLQSITSISRLTGSVIIAWNGILPATRIELNSISRYTSNRRPAGPR